MKVSNHICMTSRLFCLQFLYIRKGQSEKVRWAGFFFSEGLLESKFFPQLLKGGRGSRIPLRGLDAVPWSLKDIDTALHLSRKCRVRAVAETAGEEAVYPPSICQGKYSWHCTRKRVDVTTGSKVGSVLGWPHPRICKKCTTRSRSCQATAWCPPCEIQWHWRVHLTYLGRVQWKKLREEGHQENPKKCTLTENHHLSPATLNQVLRNRKRNKGVLYIPFLSASIQAWIRWEYWQRGKALDCMKDGKFWPWWSLTF